VFKRFVLMVVVVPVLLMAAAILLPDVVAIVGFGYVPAKSPAAAPVGAGAFAQVATPATVVNTWLLVAEAVSLLAAMPFASLASVTALAAISAVAMVKSAISVVVTVPLPI
jgi:hypothetical protein